MAQASASLVGETHEIGPVRIVRIDTLRTSLQSNVTLVVLHASDGTVGIGETFYGASAVEAYIHDVAAPALLRHHDAAPGPIARLLAGYVGYSGSGAEVRGNSAIDIALWDLLGRRADVPLRELLGGPYRDEIATYNTCAGTDYVNAESRQSSTNWGIGDGRARGPYEDLWSFLHRPGELARELVDAGFGGMKVWPFDLAAESSHGDHRADLRFGLSVLDEIRSEVGADLDLYVELHSLWTPRGATRLLKELERFDLAWAEDPIRPDHYAALGRLRADTDVPIAVGENVGAGFNAYKPLLDASAIDVAILDLGWGGGVTAGLQVAALAQQAGIPVAPHDCTGPVSLAVATHFVTGVANGHVQEVARAFYHGWYRDIADGLPEIENGMIRPSRGPGHGITLRPDFLHSPGTSIRTSAV
ncbi:MULTISPECIES: mandelate racemase/muconate lactonizing enzyme family protein [unclassified Microbacterium]|uniref:mandelate racemase/muconate lactonizing enzyme family protein n=1 Tax=unclassified Microbacterium TaxID=2609290 RepID=UPI00341B8DB8